MFARHRLVWLTPAGWQDCIASALPQHHAALQTWAEHDWPMVARRRDADLAADRVCLGLALPPQLPPQLPPLRPDTPAEPGLHKPKIALQLPRNAVQRDAPPLALENCIATAARWEPALDELHRQATQHQLRFRVLGSLAYATLTGLAYLHADSDIDIYFAPQTPDQLEHGLHILSSCAARLPLDGEIIFPGGRAVAWKEWQQVRRADPSLNAPVMFKQTSGIGLMPMRALQQLLSHPQVAA